jgi:predicted AlkP superfamily phosphohydrolase/phosphomutase
VPALVIGIDGGTFKVLEPMIDRGYMPRLKGLMSDGSYATAESVIPTNSAAAWSSIMTGLNPGKHGVFYFNELERTETGPKWGRIINFDSIHGDTLWRTLGDYGLRVCVINVPITYPPERVNGILVSGLLAPSESSDYTFPSDLKENLPGYMIDINLEGNSHLGNGNRCENIIRQVIEITQIRNRHLITLLGKEKWDFVMVVYRETDDVQHFLWHILAQWPKGGEMSSDFRRICEYFSALDSSIGEAIDRMGKETNVFVISDHGFDAAPERAFDLDAWARSRQLQFFRSDFAEMRIALIGILRRLLAFGRSDLVLDLLTRNREVANTVEFGLVKNKSNLIDWASTTAFKFGDGLALVRKTSSDIERLGPLENSIRNDLLSVTDAGGEGQPISKVISREAIYNGEFAAKAPELVIIPSAGYKLSTIPGTKMFDRTPKTEITGEHDRSGIFIASGPDIKNLAEMSQVSILDLFPTILELFDIEVPQELDGKALIPMLNLAENRKKKPRTVVRAESNNQKSATVFSDSEERDIRERLSQLGYL